MMTALSRNAAWKEAIEHSFGTDPEKCPDCNAEMLPSVVYGHNAEQGAVTGDIFLIPGLFSYLRGKFIDFSLPA